MSKRKLQPDVSNPNQDFCDFLLELSEFEKNVSRNIFKHNAYRKAASKLSQHPVRIRSGEEARKLDGIGQKIADKIDEFLHTGHLNKLDKIRASDDVVAITQLSRVSGIGPAKARELYNKGVLTLDQLRERTELLTHHQKLGLRYVVEFECRIPRPEVAAIEQHVLSRLAELDPQYRAVVCGSYRRGAESSGDVDLLLTHPSYTSSTNQKPNKKPSSTASTNQKPAGGTAANKKPSSTASTNQKPAGGAETNKKPSSTASTNQRTGGQLLSGVVSHLSEDGFITDTLSQGDSKFMGVCLLSGEEYTTHRRLDLRLVPHDQYHCAVLYFTGSDQFNRQMRTHALEHKFTLNEYTLRPLGSTGLPGEPVPVDSERDVFEYLDYPYRPPGERNL